MEKNSLYLHFLDRELYRESGMSRQDVDALISDALIIASCFSYEPLMISIAFIWEIYFDYPKTRRVIIDLLQHNLLHLISSFFSVDEMIAFNQGIYRAEPERYQMYFSKIPRNLEKYEPDILKRENTTIRIERELREWINSESSPLLYLPQDKDLIKKNGVDIINVLDKREERAITLSLFNKVELPVFSRKQLGRDLSLIHIHTYLTNLNADIVTGIRGLHFYDRLANRFPIYDYSINRQLIMICDNRVVSNYQLLLDEENVFGKQKKISFIEMSRKIISTVCSCLDIKIEEIGYPIIRTQIINYLSKFSIKMPLQMGCISWDTLLERVCLLDRILIENDIIYSKYRTKGETVMKSLLICTATDKETDAVLKKSTEIGLPVSPSNLRKYDEYYLYNLGIIGNLELLLVQTEMGTERIGSARDKIRDLARILSPDYIISTGICYGLKPYSVNKKDGNKIGDIIVANQVQMYENVKVYDEDGELEFIPRGDRAAVSTELLEIFRTASHFYQNAEVSFGLLLTGNMLVNSKHVVEKLKNLFPDALNGDMEAGGIYSACHDNKSKWIAIKAISDWGYDKSDDYQDIARQNLYDFLFFVLKNYFLY